MKIRTRLMKERDLARFLGKTPQTIRDWRTRGIGPKYIKIGHSVLYDWRHIESWIDKNTVNTNK